MIDPSLRASQLRLTAALGLFVVTLVAAALILEVEVAATGAGRIIPDGQVKQVQSFEPGIVEEIAVREGSRVQSGDLLVRLETKDAVADLERITSDLAIARVEFARLRATIGWERGEPFEPPPDSPQFAVAYSEHLMRNQIDEIVSLVSQVDAEIREKEATIASIIATIRKGQELLPILQERESMRERLLRVDAVPKITYLEDKERLVTLQGDLRIQESSLRAAQAGLDSLREKRQNAILKFRSDRLAELVEAQRKKLALEQDYIKGRERLRRHTIAAPIAGTVQDLTLYTIGGVVSSNDVLMTLVPVGTKLLVEAYVANKDVGFIESGQRAEVKVTTFDYRRYGFLSGTVLTISRDAVRGENTRNLISPAKNQTERLQELKRLNPSLDEGPVFRVEISLDQTVLNIDGKEIQLTPGMSVDVNVLTTRRRIIEFFLAPFLTYQDQAFRQR